MLKYRLIKLTEQSNLVFGNILYNIGGKNGPQFSLFNLPVFVWQRSLWRAISVFSIRDLTSGFVMNDIACIWFCNLAQVK